MNHRTLEEASRWADYWVRTYGEDRTVFYRDGVDRFGRDGLFYVRPPDDDEMRGLVAAGLVRTVYVGKADE